MHPSSRSSCGEASWGGWGRRAWGRGDSNLREEEERTPHLGTHTPPNRKGVRRGNPSGRESTFLGHVGATPVPGEAQPATCKQTVTRGLTASSAAGVGAGEAAGEVHPRGLGSPRNSRAASEQPQPPGGQPPSQVLVRRAGGMAVAPTSCPHVPQAATPPPAPGLTLERPAAAQPSPGRAPLASFAGLAVSLLCDCLVPRGSPHIPSMALPHPRDSPGC